MLSKKLLLDAAAGRLKLDAILHTMTSSLDINEWALRRPTALPTRDWSEEQAAVLEYIRMGVHVSDANVAYSHDVKSRFVYINGEPGSGKSEAVTYAAVEAASKGANVLIGCPTGVLVSSYRDRLPCNERITVETIHSAWQIARKADAHTHNPPSRLRRYELIILDEVSQLDNVVFRILLKAILELPQKPLVVFVGDLCQLQPVIVRKQTALIHGPVLKSWKSN